MPYTYDLKNTGKKQADSNKKYDLMQFKQAQESTPAPSVRLPRLPSAHTIGLPKPTGTRPNVLNAEPLQTRINYGVEDKLDALGLPQGSMIREMSRPTQGAGTFGKLKANFDNSMNSVITGVPIGQGMNPVKGQSVANLLGTLAGFAAGGKIGPNVGSGTFELGSRAVSKLPINNALAKSALGMAGGSATTEAANTLSNGDKFSPKDMAANAAANALIGAATHGLVKVAPPIVNKVAEFKNAPSWGKLSEAAPEFNPKAWNDVVAAYKAPTLQQAKQAKYNEVFGNLNLNADVGPVRHTNIKQDIESIIKPPLSAEGAAQRQSDLEAIFGAPKTVGKYSFTTGEQRALDAWNKGVQEAQNYLGHNDIYAAYPPNTPKEAIFADIQKNTGVNLLKLAADVEKAQGVKTKLTPEERSLGKAAGVLPSVKFEQPPLPTPEAPVIDLPVQRQLPTPERLTWTNKDVLPPAPKVGANPLVRLPKPEIKGDRVVAAGIEHPEAAAASLEVPLGEAMFPGKNVDFEKLNDVGNLGAYTKDVYRIFRQVFGKDAGDEILLPFDRAKEAHIDMQNNILNKLKSEVVDRLGIGKKTKESALVQKYGEGEIGLDELKQQAPKTWQNIVEADKWFRKQYDDLIEQINASRREIYPNAEANAAEIEARIEGVKKSRDYSSAEKNAIIKELETELEDVTRNKIIPKRQDYYRHFQEMTEGFKALKNIFDSPAQISTDLIGTSEFTKPKSKWASFAQKRTGNKTEYDAVGGFLNYVPAAAYATHIDPQIAFFRGLERALKDATRDSHNADNFIGFLDKYAGHLAGKTNPLDRVFQDMVPGGRKTFSALNWLNSRIKANTVLGKASSALAQFANIPTGIAFAKQYSIPGMIRSMSAIAGKNPEMEQSAFLKERFGGVGSKIYRQFDESLLNKPKEMAVWLMETADKIGTTFIWNSAYTKGLAQGVADPIRYADMATRDLVAGRGVGEVPIIQQSKLFQLIAPFQLEVGNLWHIQKDFVKAKDFGGLVALYFLNYGFNELMKATRGSGVTFDPIGAAVDASNEKDMTPAKFVGRLGGEVLSNAPMGQTFAAMYPENGMAGLPGRKELFGRNDPTRYGSSVLVAKGLQDPLFKILPPFGGDQLKKFLDGQKDLNQGAHLSGGKLAYPVAPTLPNQIKGSLFGPSAFTEAQDYYDNARKPLSDQQTQDVMKAPDKVKAYQKALTQREIDSLSTKMGEVKKNKSLTKAQQNVQIRALQLQQEALKRKLGR